MIGENSSHNFTEKILRKQKGRQKMLIFNGYKNLVLYDVWKLACLNFLSRMMHIGISIVAEWWWNEFCCA